MNGRPDSEPQSPSGWRAAPWFLLAVLTAVNAVNWADRQVVPILFPAIKGELGLSDTQLGIIGGLAFSMIYAIAAFVFGRAADRTIRTRLIAGGLVLWSAATVASGFAEGFGSLFAARFFTGIGEASLYPCAMSLIADRFPAVSRGRAMGIFGAAAAVGNGLGIGLGGYMSQTVGWRSVFFLYGSVGLLLLPLLLMIKEERRDPPPDGEPPMLQLIGSLLRDTRLLAVWACGMVMIASGIGYASWIPTYFVRERGFEVEQAGYLFGAAALLGGVVGSVLGGTFADRRRKVRLAGELDVSALVAIVAVPFVFFTLHSPSLPVALVCGLIGPIAIYAFFPSLQTMMIEIVPSRRLGVAYAINILFLGGIGSALGPFVVGYASDLTGSIRVAMQIPIIGMVLASVLAALAGRLVRARRDAEN